MDARKEVHQQSSDYELIMCVEVGQHKEGVNMGIGVTTFDSTNKIKAVWLMCEISTGLRVLDYAIALRLALCKAKGAGWDKLKIVTSCNLLNNHMKTKCSTDIRVAALLDDMKELSSLFQSISFGDASVELGDVTKAFCNHALSINIDEDLVTLGA